MTAASKISLIETLKEKLFHNNSNHNNELAELSGLVIEREYSRKQTLVCAGEKWDKVFFYPSGYYPSLLYG